MSTLQSFVSVSDLPEKYRNVFPRYRFFNRIQSAIYPRIFDSDNSIVVAAPTSAGKTVIFELAIIKCLINNEIKEFNEPKICKIIMVAPMKAICNERYRDWNSRFAYLNLNILLLTGTSDYGHTDLNAYDIIVTTPEKWDSVMRQWTIYKETLQYLELFMIDELQLVGDVSRGPTLEAVVNRMKTMNLRPGHLRMVGATAVMPNLIDVAIWLGKNGPTCEHFSFGEETRPVPLRKIVLSYPKSKNMFMFDISLNYKLANVILEHAAGKPSLVFCATRSAVETSAKEITKRITVKLTLEARKYLSDLSNQIHHPAAKNLIKHGIGIHHAGIIEPDLQIIEDAFRHEKLLVLMTTTTLSMGVNLPAHLVIIKGTRMFCKGEMISYTEAQIQQMIGRAGRPQYDTSAVAVIMTTHEDKLIYERMLNGSTPLESNLHLRLIEHLNSEIALGTLKDLGSCMDWMTTTFLYVRAEKNPRHYGMPVGLGAQEMERKLTQLYQIDINKLVSSGMAIIDENASIMPTFLGELMARHYLQFETVRNFNLIQGTESTSELLELIVKSKEYDGFFLRVAEKKTLNSFNSNKHDAIRYPMTGKIKTVDMKINCLIQTILGCLPITESGLIIEAEKIVKSADAILKCLTEHLLKIGHKFTALYSAQILSKSLRAKLWENSNFVARQLPGVGTTRARLLASHGMNSFVSLANASPNSVNSILRTNIGERITELSTHIPQYDMELKMKPRDTSKWNFTNVKLELIVRLININDLFPSTVDPSSHMQLLVGNLTTNQLLLQNKYSHNYMIETGMLCKEIGVDLDSTFEDVTVGAYFISTTWVGFDAHSEITITSPNASKKPQIQSKLKPKTTLPDYFKITKTAIFKKRVSPPQITPIISPENENTMDELLPGSEIPQINNHEENTTIDNDTQHKENRPKRQKKNIQVSDIFDINFDYIAPKPDNHIQPDENGKLTVEEGKFDHSLLVEWCQMLDNTDTDEFDDSFDEYAANIDNKTLNKKAGTEKYRDDKELEGKKIIINENIDNFQWVDQPLRRSMDCQQTLTKRKKNATLNSCISEDDVKWCKQFGQNSGRKYDTTDCNILRMLESSSGNVPNSKLFVPPSDQKTLNIPDESSKPLSVMYVNCDPFRGREVSSEDIQDNDEEFKKWCEVVEHRSEKYCEKPEERKTSVFSPNKTTANLPKPHEAKSVLDLEEFRESSIENIRDDEEIFKKLREQFEKKNVEIDEVQPSEKYQGIRQERKIDQETYKLNTKLFVPPSDQKTVNIPDEIIKPQSVMDVNFETFRSKIDSPGDIQDNEEEFKKWCDAYEARSEKYCDKTEERKVSMSSPYKTTANLLEGHGTKYMLNSEDFQKSSTEKISDKEESIKEWCEQFEESNSEKFWDGRSRETKHEEFQPENNVQELFRLNKLISKSSEKQSQQWSKSFLERSNTNQENLGEDEKIIAWCEQPNQDQDFDKNEWVLSENHNYISSQFELELNPRNRSLLNVNNEDQIIKWCQQFGDRRKQFKERSQELEQAQPFYNFNQYPSTIQSQTEFGINCGPSTGAIPKRLSEDTSRDYLHKCCKLQEDLDFSCNYQDYKEGQLDRILKERIYPNIGPRKNLKDQSEIRSIFKVPPYQQVNQPEFKKPLPAHRWDEETEGEKFRNWENWMKSDQTQSKFNQYRMELEPATSISRRKLRDIDLPSFIPQRPDEEIPDEQFQAFMNFHAQANRPSSSGYSTQEVPPQESRSFSRMPLSNVCNIHGSEDFNQQYKYQEKPAQPKEYARTVKKKITCIETTTRKVKVTLESQGTSRSYVSGHKTKKSLVWKSPLVIEHKFSPRGYNN